MKKSIFLFALLMVAIIFNNATIKAESEDFKQIWEIKKYGRAFSHFVNNQKELLCFTGNGFNLNSMEDGSFLLQVNLRNTPDVIELDEIDSLVFFSQVRGNDSSGLFMHDLRTGEQTRILGANHKNNINITLDTANDKLYFVTDSVGFEYIILCEYDYKKKDSIKILFESVDKRTQIIFSSLKNTIYITAFPGAPVGYISSFNVLTKAFKVKAFDYLKDLPFSQYSDFTFSAPLDFRISPNGRYLTLSAKECLVAKVYDLQEEKLYASINIGETQNLFNKQYRMFFINDHEYMLNSDDLYFETFDFKNKVKIKRIYESILINTKFATNDKNSTKIVVVDDDGNTRCYEASPRITGVNIEQSKDTTVLYPNPSTGLVNITLQNTIIENINIKLSKINGETLPSPPYFINGNILSLNISSLPPAT